MDTKVGKRALTQLSKRMDNLNEEFLDIAKELEKLSASDFNTEYYGDILQRAQNNRITWREAKEEINRLIELEQFMRLFK